MTVPRGEILQRPTPVMLVLDAHGTRLAERRRRVTPAPGLDGRLLVGREHVFIGAQEAPLEPAMIESEDHPGFAQQAELRLQLDARTPGDARAGGSLASVRVKSC